MAVSHAMGMVMSRIILTLLWIVAFGLYAAIWRIGRLFSRAEKRETYWEDIPQPQPDHLRHQF